MNTGVILDPRPAIEKLKDYDSREILAGDPQIIWEEREPKFYSEKNQSTSLSCMAQSGAKMLGINFSPYREISAYGIYRERANFPSGGMWNQDVGEILTKKFVSFNEKSLPSQFMGESEMNKQYVVTEEMKEEAKQNDALKYIFVPNNFNEIVKVLASGYPVQIMIFANDNEFWKEFPEVIDKKLTVTTAGFRHGVTAVDYVLKNKKKYIVIEDSAGNHTTKKGQRYLSEDFVNTRVYGSMYITVFSDKVEPFIFKKVMRFGQQSEDIRKMQEVLQQKGFFPKNQTPTGYYGGITRKAVKDFQIHSGIKHNEGWQAGPQTLSALNKTMNKIPTALQSSVNPNELSLTIKGVLLALVPVVIILARFSGLEVTETELVSSIEEVTIILSALITAYGLVRKIIVKLKE